MKWFRKSLLWMSVLGSFSSAAAQEPLLPARSTPGRGVTLGRPAPLRMGPVDSTSVRVIAETSPPAEPVPVRLTSFAAPPLRTARGAAQEEPKTLYLTKEAPPLEADAPPAPVVSRPAPLRWLFRPVALQQAGEGGKDEKTAGPNQDIKVFVAPQPTPVPSLTPAPAAPPPCVEINPWTGAPMDGSSPDLAEPMATADSPLTGAFLPGQGYRFYASAEYLLWWTRGFSLPPLVATGPANVPENIRGAPGGPGTVLLFGNSTTSSGPQSGARFMAGWFIDPCGLWAVEAGGFFLGRRSDSFHADSSQFPVLSRPFFNVNTGQFDRELTATPGLLPGDLVKLRGSIDVNDHSQLWGAEANVRRFLCGGCNYYLSALAGFRYLSLREGVTVQENITSFKALPGTNIFNPGNQITVIDSFQTQNNFYGGQVGLGGLAQRGRWSLFGNAKLGVGMNHQTVDINGSQTVTTLAGTTQTFNGGLLALPSNSGHFTRDQVSFVPEINLNVGYNVTSNLRLFVGYDVLYWTNVIRPGDQIDLALNANQIPNSGVNPPSNVVRPVVPFRSTSFWAQGINAGVMWTY